MLYRFFEGSASTDEIKKVKEWTEESEDNYRQFLKERKLFDFIQLFDISSYVKSSKYIGIKKNRYLREIIKIAAVIIFTLGLTSVLFFSNRKDNNIAMQTIIVPEGQRVNVILPDGTDVWLNSGTKMSYPLSFISKSRRVELDGEAYFDVVRDESNPFVVHTSYMDVEVLGTKFNVSIDSVAGVFSTILETGKVKLTSLDKHDELILNPGQMCKAFNDSIMVCNVNTNLYTAWKDEYITINSLKLDDVMKMLESCYHTNIYIEDDTLKKSVFSGRFSRDNTLLDILTAIQSTTPFTIMEKDGSYYIECEQN